MCGITGFVDFNKQSSEQILQAMTATMHHRGPDGEGVYFKQQANYQLGFGHKRLSIIDLSSGGTQPMHYLHYSILLNGEIYNYAEIKTELQNKGHQFVSTSDTEVALHAYIEWGEAFVHKLIGMFATVIYNAHTHQIYIVRDRAGVKPFIYYWHQGLFLFTSEYKAFHKHPYFKKHINKDAVAAYMQYGYVPTPHSIFEHCYKLQPGHSAILNLDTQVFTISKYWHVNEYYNMPKLDISFEEAKKHTKNLLTKAFEYRLVADVPVGVFLSGGYDSTCVAALLQQNAGKQLNTFTIGVGHPKLNEAPFAKHTAQLLGTKHTELYCTEQDALDIVPQLPYFYDEPFGDSSAIPTTLVSKLARKYVTVALSADAGDEVFAGYNRYDFEAKLGWLRNIPQVVRTPIAAILKHIPAHRIPKLSAHPMFAYRYNKLVNIIKDASSINLMNNLTQEFNTSDINTLMLKLPKALPNNFIEQLQAEYTDGISQMMATDYRTYMLDDILQKVDRATMSTSLEGREPFLDHNIIEWAAQLPTHFKYHKGIKKHIIKEIVHDYIPQATMQRPKMGFAIPIAQWLGAELQPLVQQYINEQAITSQQIFNWQAVDSILKHFNNGRHEYATKVWYLLMFQMWYKQWMS
jgi:asparagine synthase (glutamine-hydrolysing)